MQFDDLPIGTPSLEDAIDRHPLIVSPQTPLLEAIALMNQTRADICSMADSILDGSIALRDTIPLTGARSSCVLAIEGDELVGIFTERDIVRLTAAGVDFAGVRVDRIMARPIITFKHSEFQDIFAVLFLFRRYQMRHLVIVDDREKLVGVVSSESIRRVLRPANLLKMRRVSEVMTTPVIQAPLSSSMLSIARLMAEHRVSCVVIVEADAEPFALPAGIVTERDIVQFQALGLNLSHTPAEAVMSSPLFLLSPEDSLWTAHREMQKRRVRRLVVSWNWGSGLGIVTQTSLLRIFDPMEMYGVVETLQRTVDELENKRGDGALGGKFSPEVPVESSPLDGRIHLANLRTCLERLTDRSSLSSLQQDAIVAQALAALSQLEQNN
ncbi:CBS domain-containing protein [Oscillatoriales cyanobacterium LEGE 11467]|uniref:CBS domain-containing protein n=1 Tax=Zarconia navalis LEGE 11467 TaxID=1828826 RepID=A0A928VW86_9CYAN|nr:CBS domain-containing protein [Zarconia navalis]MBE9039391.1 CBS domain-containing protein [Zarconia navalis LEGE 11467]